METHVLFRFVVVVVVVVGGNKKEKKNYLSFTRKRIDWLVLSFRKEIQKMIVLIVFHFAVVQILKIQWNAKKKVNDITFCFFFLLSLLCMRCVVYQQRFTTSIRKAILFLFLNFLRLIQFCSKCKWWRVEQIIMKWYEDVVNSLNLWNFYNVSPSILTAIDCVNGVNFAQPFITLPIIQ